MQEADLGKAKAGASNPESYLKITNWVHQISKKVPEIRTLENKLGMMQGLDPVLEDIVSDLNTVTDFSSLAKLKETKEMFDIRADEEDEERQIANLRETLAAGDEQAAPTSSAPVSKILRETAADVEDADTVFDSKAAKKAAVRAEEAEEGAAPEEEAPVEPKKAALDTEAAERTTKLAKKKAVKAEAAQEAKSMAKKKKSAK